MNLSTTAEQIDSAFETMEYFTKIDSRTWLRKCSVWHNYPLIIPPSKNLGGSTNMFLNYLYFGLFNQRIPRYILRDTFMCVFDSEIKRSEFELFLRDVVEERMKLN